MKLELHHKAVENFDKKIAALVNKLRFRSQPKIVNQPLNPDVHVAGHFDETNIIGEIKLYKTDSSGEVSARMFNVRKKEIGLFDDDYKELRGIAENIQRSTEPSNVVSLNILSELIFDWLKLKYLGESKHNPTDFVLSECEKLIDEIEIWIPISHLHIQSSFKLGNITFNVITKKLMDDYENSVLKKIEEEEDKQKLKHYFEKKRSKIQNLAVATMKVNAEPEQAYKIAFEDTERALSILRFYSPFNLLPNKICYCAPIEKQHMDKDYFLVVKDGMVVKENSGLSDKAVDEWNISNQKLNEYNNLGLGFLGSLLTKRENDLTDFQKKFLEAIFIYSKASLAKQLSDRLIYTLVALETIFLKDENEPIQDNISLRMAYMHKVGLNERKEIIKNIKETYKLRSAFIHHGKQVSVEELEVLNKGHD